jgi:hypothetical protein
MPSEAAAAIRFPANHDITATANVMMTASAR